MLLREYKWVDRFLYAPPKRRHVRLCPLLAARQLPTDLYKEEGFLLFLQDVYTCFGRALRECPQLIGAHMVFELSSDKQLRVLTFEERVADERDVKWQCERLELARPKYLLAMQNYLMRPVLTAMMPIHPPIGDLPFKLGLPTDFYPFRASLFQRLNTVHAELGKLCAFYRDITLLYVHVSTPQNLHSSCQLGTFCFSNEIGDIVREEIERIYRAPEKEMYPQRKESLLQCEKFAEWADFLAGLSSAKLGMRVLPRLPSLQSLTRCPIWRALLESLSTKSDVQSTRAMQFIIRELPLPTHIVQYLLFEY